MAMRWSPRLSKRAPRSGPPTPVIGERVALDRWPRAPKASTMSATAASRSTSLTRSSPTSVKTVVPSATAAATARAGISSSEGISLARDLGGRAAVPAAARMVAVRGLGRRSSVTSAPMRWSTATKPSRAGPP